MLGTDVLLWGAGVVIAWLDNELYSRRECPSAEVTGFCCLYKETTVTSTGIPLDKTDSVISFAHIVCTMTMEVMEHTRIPPILIMPLCVCNIVQRTKQNMRCIQIPMNNMVPPFDSVNLADREDVNQSLSGHAYFACRPHSAVTGSSSLCNRSWTCSMYACD